MAATPPATPPADAGAAAAANADKTPTIVKMARAAHELVTGKKPTDVIAPGEFITDAVAKKHSLDASALADLVSSGAVELVDVHKG
jgi:hypothetical protein